MIDDGWLLLMMIRKSRDGYFWSVSLFSLWIVNACVCIHMVGLCCLYICTGFPLFGHSTALLPVHNVTLFLTSQSLREAIDTKESAGGTRFDDQ